MIHSHNAHLPPAHGSPRPLADLPKDAHGIVVDHAIDPGTAERLWALGLGLGARFLVVRSGHRPTLRVGETRIAVGSEIARSVKAVLR